MLIKKMTINSAKEIIKWKYESPYNLYEFWSIRRIIE